MGGEGGGRLELGPVLGEGGLDLGGGVSGSFVLMWDPLGVGVVGVGVVASYFLINRQFLVKGLIESNRIERERERWVELIIGL